MKPTMILKTTCFAAILTLLSQGVFAFESKPIDEKICKPPKMLDFSLPEYSGENRVEVQPEAEFSFKLSGTPAEKIQVKARETPLTIDVKENSSFTLVSGKLPPEFTGQFVRLNVWVHTELGCMSRDGWLIKVAAGSPASQLQAQ